MPFTFAHPAIVLPLVFLPRKWYSLTGLVIGSLTPDFEYFIRMNVRSDYSHTLSGVLWFDLPVGLLLAFLFHNVVRNSLFSNLPMVLKERLSVFKQFNWNEYFRLNWLVVILSILIGAYSHLFWDSFTHEHGYFVQVIPGLNKMFKIAQHASTLLGALVILYSIFKLPVDAASPGISYTYWGILIVITLVVMIARSIHPMLIGQLVVTGISAVLIALIFTPLLYKK